MSKKPEKMVIELQLHAPGYVARHVTITTDFALDDEERQRLEEGLKTAFNEHFECYVYTKEDLKNGCKEADDKAEQLLEAEKIAEENQ